MNCDGEIDAGEMAVAAVKLGEELLWHAACFTCTCCHELLVSLCYCCKDGNVYCERHYAELVRPRCAACDEVLNMYLLTYLLTERSAVPFNSQKL